MVFCIVVAIVLQSAIIIWCGGRVRSCRKWCSPL